MRATLDDVGLPQAVANYDAWGVPETTAIAPFGFTGELQRGNDVWLRARWYGAGRGGFGARDAYQGEATRPYSLMPYQYAYANPTRWVDPSGAVPVPPLQGVGDMTEALTIAAMQSAITAARGVYSKMGDCLRTPDDGQHPTDEVSDLWLDYICEYGSADRVFNADSVLTQQLSQTYVVQIMRDRFYASGPFEDRQGGQMGSGGFLQAKLSDAVTTGRWLTITDFLGGLNAWRVTWDTWGTTYEAQSTIRFELYNVTSLMSGTRVGFTHKYTREISYEDYLTHPELYNRDKSATVGLGLIDTNVYSLISVLTNKNYRDPNNPYGLGGGTMTQRFIWEEPYDSCYWGQAWAFQRPGRLYMTKDWGRWP